MKTLLIFFTSLAFINNVAFGTDSAAGDTSAAPSLPSLYDYGTVGKYTDPILLSAFENRGLTTDDVTQSAIDDLRRDVRYYALDSRIYSLGPDEASAILYQYTSNRANFIAYDVYATRRRASDENDKKKRDEAYKRTLHYIQVPAGFTAAAAGVALGVFAKAVYLKVVKKDNKVNLKKAALRLTSVVALVGGLSAAGSGLVYVFYRLNEKPGPIDL